MFPEYAWQGLAMIRPPLPLTWSLLFLELMTASLTRILPEASHWTDENKRGGKTTPLHSQHDGVAGLVAPALSHLIASYR